MEGWIRTPGEVGLASKSLRQLVPLKQRRSVVALSSLDEMPGGDLYSLNPDGLASFDRCRNEISDSLFC